MGLIAGGLGRAVPLQRVEQTPHKGDDDQGDQNGAEHLAQPVRQLFRPERHQQRPGEKRQGKEESKQLQRGIRPRKGGYRHLKGGAGRARNGQAGPDGQVGRHSEHPGEHRVDPAAQGVQPARAGHRHHPQHGQAHGADGHAGHGRPGVNPRLGPQSGGKDQVACSEEHGEQSEAHQQKLFSILFFHSVPQICIFRRARARLLPVYPVQEGFVKSFRSPEQEKNSGAPMARRCFMCVCSSASQPWEIAPVGQASAQEPQSMQVLASITYWESP